jgi:hypothetical protein
MGGVRLIPDRLGRAEGGQEPQLAELRQRGVDRAAAEIGQRLRRSGVDLIGREMLGGAALERTENGAALGVLRSPRARSSSPAWSERRLIGAFSRVKTMFGPSDKGEYYNGHCLI